MKKNLTYLVIGLVITYFGVTNTALNFTDLFNQDKLILKFEVNESIDTNEVFEINTLKNANKNDIRVEVLDGKTLEIVLLNGYIDEGAVIISEVSDIYNNSVTHSSTSQIYPSSRQFTWYIFFVLMIVILVLGIYLIVTNLIELIKNLKLM